MQHKCTNCETCPEHQANPNSRFEGSTGKHAYHYTTGAIHSMCQNAYLSQVNKKKAIQWAAGAAAFSHWKLDW